MILSSATCQCLDRVFTPICDVLTCHLNLKYLTGLATVHFFFATTKMHNSYVWKVFR